MRKQMFYILISLFAIVGGFTYSPTYSAFDQQIIGTPVCWKSTSDINLIRYDLVSTSASPGKVLFYVDASGAKVNVPGGAILKNGWCCPCSGDSAGGSYGPDTSLYSMDGVISENRFVEIDSLIYTMDFEYNFANEQYNLRMGQLINIDESKMGASFYYKEGTEFAYAGLVGEYNAGAPIPMLQLTQSGSGSTTRLMANRGVVQMQNSYIGNIEIHDSLGLRVYDERWRFGRPSPGLVYAFNTRAHYSDSTLIDKGYADSTLLNLTGEIALPVYADDAAAGSGGLSTGDFYRTSTGEVRIKL